MYINVVAIFLCRAFFQDMDVWWTDGDPSMLKSWSHLSENTSVQFS